MRTLLVAAIVVAACGGQREPDGLWKIGMADQCAGTMILGTVHEVPGIQLTGVWSCGEKYGGVTGQLDKGAIHLEMSEPTPLEMVGTYAESKIAGTLTRPADGSTMSFVASR